MPTKIVPWCVNFVNSIYWWILAYSIISVKKWHKKGNKCFNTVKNGKQIMDCLHWILVPNQNM